MILRPATAGLREDSLPKEVPQATNMEPDHSAPLKVLANGRDGIRSVDSPAENGAGIPRLYDESLIHKVGRMRS